MGPRRWLRSLRRPSHALGVESRFAKQAPSAQATADIFADGWASRLPLPGVTSGSHDLFDDPRVRWFLEEIGGVSGRRVVELGPLEGAHSFMLQQAGAREVVAVESNARAYLKCLVAKELLGSDRCRFLYGDFREYLRSTEERFDVAIASGVLYHLTAPYELFPLVAARCTGPVLVWTHYWDETIERRMHGLHRRFSGKRTAPLASGAQVECRRHEYRETARIARFWGGNAPYSEWMTRDGVFAAAEAGGYRVQAIREEPEHVNGPAIAMVLQRAS